MAGVFRSWEACGGGGFVEGGSDGEESGCVLVGVLVWTWTSASLPVSASVSVSKILVSQNLSFPERRASNALPSHEKKVFRNMEGLVKAVPEVVRKQTHAAKCAVRSGARECKELGSTCGHDSRGRPLTLADRS